MEHHVRRQKGFLLIITIAILVILSFVGLVIVNIFNNQVGSATNLDQSNDAYHLAFSGMEIAKRDLASSAVTCSNLSIQHTNRSLLEGQFSATGQRGVANSTLQAALTTSSTSIPVTNGIAFASKGIIQIGSEYIYYGSKTGNVLSQLNRGKRNTAITAHASGSRVFQNQCFITVNAGAPNLTLESASKATISAVIVYTTFSIGGYQPSVASGDNATVSGNGRVYNSSVVLNGPGFQGSTIVSLRDVNFSGNGDTAVGNGSGGAVVSSSRSQLGGDVVSNLSLNNTLFQSYFGTLTEAQLIAQAASTNQFYSTFDAPAMNGAKNSVIYVAGDASLSGSNTLSLGTNAEPVVLYIKGDLTVTGSAILNVNGIIFVEGNINFNGNSTLSGSVSMGSGGRLGIGGSGEIGSSPSDVVNLQLTQGEAITNVYSNLIPGAATGFISTGFGVQPSVTD